jgi:serine/threonine protein kinase/tetratricopeptide (TPR) repeat protein
MAPVIEGRPLSPSAVLRLDQACNRFEDAWKQALSAGGRPRLEDYLVEAPEPERSLLLHELLVLELLYRGWAGERPTLPDYRSRFPGHEAILKAAFAAAARERGPEYDSLQTGRHSPTPRMTWSPERTCPELPPEAEPAADLPNVPGYELLRPLGQGGMGVVYLARQVGLNRLVALKMIRPRTNVHPEYLARFLAEAEVVARLQHPHIVQIHEVGQHEGLPFFSLEYVDGGSLDRKLAGTTLAAGEAAGLVQMLAGAVQAAHERSLVHRDLKPANILLQRIHHHDTKDTKEREEVWGDYLPKIADFGLAKQLDADSGQTRTGAIMGTPSYMAPEQAEGRGKDLGPWTDVYALGCILYELLTGRPPFKGTSVWDTIDQLRRLEPVPPSRLAARTPRDLETICLKCLHKEWTRRYGSARELAEDLRRFLEGEPIRARPVSAWERGCKWARRRPAQAALVVAVGLVVLASAAGGVFYGLYRDQQASASQQREAALVQQFKRRRLADDLWDQARAAELAGQLETAAEKCDRALATFDADPEAADEELRGRIAEERERVRRLLQDQTARQQLLARIREFRKRRDDILYHELSPTERDRAAHQAEVRRLAPAALALWDLTGAAGQPPAVSAARAARALEPYRSYFLSLGEVGETAAGCYEVLLVWAEAEADVPLTAPASERQAGAHRALALLDAATALGQAYQVPIPQAFHVRRARYLSLAGDERAARGERERSARLPPTTALDDFLSALASWQRGQLSQCAHACEEVLRLQPDHFWAQYLHALCRLKARHWEEGKVGLTACLAQRHDLLWPRLFRATAEGELGEAEAAEKDFAQVLTQASDPLARYVVLTNRGAFWVRQKRWNEALADLGQAIQLRPDAYQAYVNLAQVYRGRKDYGAAVAALGQALERHPRDAGLYQTRARIHLERQDWQAARRDFEQAIALELPGTNPERLASAWVELGHLKHRAGDFPAALECFQQALGARPDYPPAHRERAEMLLTQGKYAEAGRALERYLRAGGRPTREVCKAQGLIRARLREYPEAVEAYTRALALGPDATTLAYRGWVYLKLEAPRAALRDFEEALKRDPDQADALCGRGHARLSLGQVADAVADAERALRRGSRVEQVLFNAACLYARADRQAETVLSGDPGAGYQAARRYRERALELLRAALEQVPEGRRAAYWRRTVETEPSLLSLRGRAGLLQLARAYGR